MDATDAVRAGVHWRGDNHLRHRAGDRGLGAGLALHPAEPIQGARLWHVHQPEPFRRLPRDVAAALPRVSADRPHQPADTHPARLLGPAAAVRRGGEHVARRLDFQHADAGGVDRRAGVAEAVPTPRPRRRRRRRRCGGSVFRDIGVCPGTRRRGRQAGHDGARRLAHRVVGRGDEGVAGGEAARRRTGAFRPPFPGAPAGAAAVAPGAGAQRLPQHAGGLGAGRHAAGRADAGNDGLRNHPELEIFAAHLERSLG